MLATSSPSPSTFKYGTSRNVQAIAEHSVYHQSPRLPLVSALKSPGTATITANSSVAVSPPLRPNYQNASTQYSPMGDISRDLRPKAPAKCDTEGVDDASISGDGSTSTIARPAVLTSSSIVAPGHGSVIQQSPQSPTTKRRSFKDSIDAGPPSMRPQPSAPKRPKSSKMPVKILPVRYELCDVEDMVILIADMISELIETNDNLPLRDVVLTRFHSRTPPGISVIDYLQRLAKHAALTPPLLLSMVYYIDRLCSLYPAFTITTLTVHRFLITAATVAAKGLSDSFWNNSTYARVGGIKLAELGLLELELLYRVDWRIVPKPETLVEYYQGLIGRTDNYVLESDTSIDNPDAQLSGSGTIMVDELGDSIVTDTKWQEWMKDVAHSSRQK